ncbi:MAG: hypothetical protein EBU85_01155 [Actinobacteria bacterium]|nr:hypothetical protein [Actinomycetota bacterium]
MAESARVFNAQAETYGPGITRWLLPCYRCVSHRAAALWCAPHVGSDGGLGAVLVLWAMLGRTNRFNIEQPQLAGAGSSNSCTAYQERLLCAQRVSGMCSASMASH